MQMKNFLDAVAVVGVDEGADFVAVEGLGPLVDEFQLFDLGTQEVTEVTPQDFAEHGFDGQKLGLPRVHSEDGGQVGGFVGGNGFGKYLFPLQASLLADIVGLANGVQGLGIVGRFGQFQEFENFVLHGFFAKPPGS